MTASYHIRKDQRTGTYYVLLTTAHGKKRITTGEREYKRAFEKCDAALIAKLQMAADAGVLNANAISVLTTGRRFTCADVFEAWKEEAAIDLAPDTLNGYALTLEAFIKQAEIAKRPIAMVTRAQLDHFVNAKDSSLSVRRNRMSAARSFFGFAVAAAYCSGNIADRIIVRIRDLEFKRVEPRLVLPITEEEYERIIASPKAEGFFRWATALSYWLGLRLRDVACLEWASLGEDTIIVHTKKTGQRVALPLDNPLIGSGDLKLILREIMENLPEDKRDPVYCFPKEREIILAITRRAFLSVGYKRVLARCGIKGKSFHGLRHACAMRLQAAGLTIEEIGDVLGHASTDTTQIYLNSDHPIQATA